MKIQIRRGVFETFEQEYITPKGGKVIAFGDITDTINITHR